MQLPFTDSLADQGPLWPGMAGWWRVLAAQPKDVRSGDIIQLMLERDEYEVLEALGPGSGKLRLRYGFRVKGNDQPMWLGALYPVRVLRWGTGYMLADSVRI